MCTPIWKQFYVCTYLEAVLCVHLAGSSFMCVPIWKQFYVCTYLEVVLCVHLSGSSFCVHLSRAVNINVYTTVDRMKVHIPTVML